MIIPAARMAASIVIIAIVIDVVAAQSQTPPRAAPRAASPADKSGYCISGSAGFLISEDQGIAESKSKCKRGDTVIIPAARTRIIARLCDFTKSILTAGENAVCVLTGTDRAER